MFSAKTPKSASQVIELIQRQKALIKVIQSDLGVDKHWIFLLEQLANPGTVRPIKPLKDSANREKIYDCEKGVWLERKITEARGRPKNTIYTKKTATSLLPPHGKMHFFDTHKYSVGLLFDIELCHVKSKYVFNSNQGTNNAWWIEGQPYSDQASNNGFTTLGKIREDHAKTLEIPKWNEILTRLSKESVAAVFATKNLPGDRLNALHKKFVVQHYLNIDVPIFIIAPDLGFQEYTEQQQFADIASGSKLKSDTVSYQFIKDFPYRTLYEKNKKYFDYIKEQKASFDHIFDFLVALEQKEYTKAATLYKKLKLDIANICDNIDDILASPLGTLFLSQEKSSILNNAIEKHQGDRAKVEFLLANYLEHCNAHQRGNVFLTLLKYNLPLFNTMEYPCRHTWYLTNSKDFPLHIELAKEEPNEDIVEYILNSRDNLHSKNIVNETPLDILFKKKHYHLLDLWLSKFSDTITESIATWIVYQLILDNQLKLAKKALRVDLKFNINYNPSPLLLAIEKEDKELITLLLHNRFSIGAKDSKGQTSLDLLKNKPDELKWLLAAGGDNSNKEERGELFLNLLKINRQLAEYFLDTFIKMTFNAKDEKGNKPIHLLLQEDKLDIPFIQKVLEIDINLEEANQADKKPIDYFIAAKNIQFIELLINKFQKKLSQNVIIAIFMLTIEMKWTRLTDALLQQQNKLSKLIYEKKLSPLHKIVEIYDEKEVEERLTKLLAKGFNLEERNFQDVTILDALKDKPAYETIFKNFILKLSSIESGRQLISLLSKKKYSLVEYILQQVSPDPSVWYSNSKQNYLHIALSDPAIDISIVEKLVKLRNNLETKDSQDNMPIQFALRNVNPDIFKFIIEKWGMTLSSATVLVLLTEMIVQKNIPAAKLIVQNTNFSFENIDQKSMDLFFTDEWKEANTLLLESKNYNPTSLLEKHLSFAEHLSVIKACIQRLSHNNFSNILVMMAQHKRMQALHFLISNHVEKIPYAKLTSLFAFVEKNDRSLSKKLLCYKNTILRLDKNTLDRLFFDFLSDQKEDHIYLEHMLEAKANPEIMFDKKSVISKVIATQNYCIIKLILKYSESLSLGALVGCIVCLLTETSQNIQYLNKLTALKEPKENIFYCFKSIVNKAIADAKTTADIFLIVNTMTHVENELKLLQSNSLLKGFDFKWGNIFYQKPFAHFIEKAQHKMFELALEEKPVFSQKIANFLNYPIDNKFKLFLTRNIGLEYANLFVKNKNVLDEWEIIPSQTVAKK